MWRSTRDEIGGHAHRIPRSTSASSWRTHRVPGRPPTSGSRSTVPGGTGRRRPEMTGRQQRQDRPRLKDVDGSGTAVIHVSPGAPGTRSHRYPRMSRPPVLSKAKRRRSVCAREQKATDSRLFAHRTLIAIERRRTTYRTWSSRFRQNVTVASTRSSRSTGSSTSRLRSSRHRWRSRPASMCSSPMG